MIKESKFLVHEITRGTLAKYIVDKVKTPLRKMIILAGKRIPKPTRENLLHPNSHVLMDIKEEYLKHDTNNIGGRKEMFESAFNLLIVEYEHDPYYRNRFEWFINEINTRKWKPYDPTRQINFWNK